MAKCLKFGVFFILIFLLNYGGEGKTGQSLRGMMGHQPILPLSTGLWYYACRDIATTFCFSGNSGMAMVRNYKKKTKRGEWSKEAMKKSVDDVLAKKSGFRKATSTYGVPQTTSER